MKNFTLLDLLFTAITLAALALVAPLAAQQAVENAKLAACADKLRAIGVAEHAYAADNKSELAMNERGFIQKGGTVRCATFSKDTPPMLLIRGGYLKNPDKPKATIAETREHFFRCPEDSVNFVAQPVTGWRAPHPVISYMYCWFGTVDGLKSYSYPHKTKPNQPDNYGLRSNIDRDDPGWYIFADLIRSTSRNMAGRKESGKANHPGMLNALYLGGHVKTHAVTEAQEKHVATAGNRFTLFFDDVD